MAHIIPRINFILSLLLSMSFLRLSRHAWHTSLLTYPLRSSLIKSLMLLDSIAISLSTLARRSGRPSTFSRRRSISCSWRSNCVSSIYFTPDAHLASLICFSKIGSALALFSAPDKFVLSLISLSAFRSFASCL